MYNILHIILIISTYQSIIYSQTDFVHDNILYKTLYPVELKKFMIEHPNAVLIDVRSPGEFADTSRYSNLNQGKIKGAINIPIDSVDKKMSLLQSYMDLPIVLYCSYSQRSRRVGKKLSENGFKSIYNLNAGLTWINQSSEKSFPGKNELLTHDLPYKLVSVKDAYTLYRKCKDLKIIDVRPSEQYNSNDSIKTNNIGRLTNSINIVEKDGKIDLKALIVPKSHPILIYDTYGQKSGHIARYLTETGYQNVFNLAGGLNAVYTYSKSSCKLRKSMLNTQPGYKLIGPREAVKILSSSKKITIIDVRSEEEFNNTAKVKWKNVGRIKNSKNLIPDLSSLNDPAIPMDKKTTIFVYGSDLNALNFSHLLTKQGYSSVYCLNNGLWSLVYSHTNIPGYEKIDDLMENYKGFF